MTNEEFKQKVLEKIALLESEASDDKKNPKIAMFIGILRFVFKEARKKIDEDPKGLYDLLSVTDMHLDEVLAAYEDSTEQTDICDRKDTERQDITG